jgi:hypothetical protein
MLLKKYSIKFPLLGLKINSICSNKDTSIIYFEIYLFLIILRDSSVFLIIYGKIVMTSKYFGVIGVLKMADTIGEDVIFAQAKTRFFFF